MAYINKRTKEIHCKILYLGAQGAGKTSNLKSIYKNTSTEYKTGLVTISNQVIADRYYEFLPLTMGHVQGYHIKLHLYTLPFLGFYPLSELFLFKNIDGAVFVIDSQAEYQIENLDYVSLVSQYIEDYNKECDFISKVYQYNKRDTESCIAVELLQNTYNPKNYPHMEACATKGEGVMETLLELTKQILTTLIPNREKNASL